MDRMEHERRDHERTGRDREERDARMQYDGAERDLRERDELARDELEREEEAARRRPVTARRRTTTRSSKEARERETLGDLAEGWPKTARKAVEEMVEKYGEPDEITPTHLVWFDNGPWKRTVAYRDEIPHAFPKPHVDVLEQWIDYRVPIEKVGEVVAFDGSVIIDRTRGEIAARCDSEEMNVLTLNLVHEIAMGKRSVEDARKLYAESAAAYMVNRPVPYMEKLRFVGERDTGDPDESMMSGAMFRQTVEKVKDVFRSGEPGPQ